jgi:hypothetical protein
MKIGLLDKKVIAWPESRRFSKIGRSQRLGQAEKSHGFLARGQREASESASQKIGGQAKEKLSGATLAFRFHWCFTARVLASFPYTRGAESQNISKREISLPSIAEKRSESVPKTAFRINARRLSLKLNQPTSPPDIVRHPTDLGTLRIRMRAKTKFKEARMLNARVADPAGSQKREREKKRG